MEKMVNLYKNLVFIIKINLKLNKKNSNKLINCCNCN